MTFTACPNCGKQINVRAERCKYCGWRRDGRAAASAVGAGPGERVSPRKAVATVALVAVLGTVAGAALWLAADSLSRSDIAGGTFRGNGALAVPFLGGPILMLAGWALLALAFRSWRGPTSGWQMAGFLLLPAALVAGFIAANVGVPAWAASQSMARGGHTATLL